MEWYDGGESSRRGLVSRLDLDRDRWTEVITKRGRNFGGLGWIRSYRLYIFLPGEIAALSSLSASDKAGMEKKDLCPSGSLGRPGIQLFASRP
jgi:hypothetical protein